MGKESVHNAGDPADEGLIPGSGRSSEKGVETHLTILAWKIPWTDEPGRLLCMGSQMLDTTERLTRILFDAEVI